MSAPAPITTARIVAHRGCPDAGPENSAPAFRAAVERGLEAVELDVHPTADGDLVVLHDDTPERMTGETRRAGELTTAELKSRPVSGDSGVTLLTLAEALAILAPPMIVDIEIKADEMASPDDLAARLERDLAGRAEGIVVTCDSVRILKSVRLRLPALARGIVFTADERRKASALARSAQPALVVAHESRVVEVMADLGPDVEAWAYTVDDPGRARELLEAGVSRIVTDAAPALLRG